MQEIKEKLLRLEIETQSFKHMIENLHKQIEELRKEGDNDNEIT